ncbi:MAG: ABC-2 type transport system ATP-binding protein [Candidatus Nitrosomirales archaeon]|jgi:ABC-2 type transport system ATP-binding protein
MSCITADNLYKSYGNVKALDGISLNVDYGKVFGFLGPNGAGKTTAIKIFTTLIQPTSGKVSILGYDLLKQPNMIKQKIGVVQQKPSFESNLTVEGSLNLYGKLWNISNGERNKRVQDLLKMFAIEDIRNVKNEELSIGHRRRVQVAREFMHEMDLLFLDEPTIGLDPSARRTLLDYIKQRVREGLTVFFTTHIMEEAEYLCDEIAIINNGKIIALDTPSGLKQKFGGVKVIEIKLKEPFNGIEKVVNALGISSVELQDSTSIKISAENAEQILIRVIESLNKNNAQVASISVNPPSLEEIFLAMVDGANESSS